MAKTFLNLIKIINPQIQESQCIPSKKDKKMNPRQIMIKLLKINDKKKTLKSTGEKVTHRISQKKDQNDSGFHTRNDARKTEEQYF